MRPRAQVTGHIGGNLTEQHAAVLVSYYYLWLSAYSSGVERCRSELLSSVDGILAAYNVVQMQAASAQASQEITSTLFRNIYSGEAAATFGRSDRFSDICANITPTDEGYLQHRQGPSE